MYKITLIALLICSVYSCRSTQTYNQSTEKQVLTVTDTIFVEKTAGVSDTIRLPLPSIQTTDKQCDSLCQYQLQEALHKMAFHRQSLQAQVGMYFDKYKKQLVLYQQLQEQMNVYKSQNKSIIQEKKVEIIKEKPLKYIPTYVQYLAWIGTISLGYFAFKLYKIIKIWKLTKNF